MNYGWLFENPDDEISGDNNIDLEHLPPELKQVALQRVQNQIDRDTAEKKVAELIQLLEFDVTTLVWVSGVSEKHHYGSR